MQKVLIWIITPVIIVSSSVWFAVFCSGHYFAGTAFFDPRTKLTVTISGKSASFRSGILMASSEPRVSTSVFILYILINLRTFKMVFTLKKCFVTSSFRALKWKDMIKHFYRRIFAQRGRHTTVYGGGGQHRVVGYSCKWCTQRIHSETRCRTWLL